MNTSDDTRNVALPTDHDGQLRRPYKAPQLTCIGTVRSLTLSGSTTPAADPGTSKKTGL